jgi:hypothetical protein
MVGSARSCRNNRVLYILFNIVNRLLFCIYIVKRRCTDTMRRMNTIIVNIIV